MRTEPTTNLLPLRARDRKPYVFPVPAFIATASYVGIESTEKISRDAQKVVDTEHRSAVEFAKSSIPTNTSNDSTRRRLMTLTKTGTNKRGTIVRYSGAARTLSFPLAAFPQKIAPDTIDVAEAIFAPAKPPKTKMTAEERKAARANKPKPTAAERAAKLEKRLAKLREQAAAEQSGADATM